MRTRPAHPMRPNDVPVSAHQSSHHQGGSGPPLFHDILVAVDGSPEAEAALTQAIDLAGPEHSRMTLITGVQQPPSIAFADATGDAVVAIESDARARADAV